MISIIVASPTLVRTARRGRHGWPHRPPVFPLRRERLPNRGITAFLALAPFLLIAAAIIFCT